MDLAKTQGLSLVTKAITTALGIAQSIIVVRLLTRGDFGLVGLVLSIGTVIGVSQHLGIVDGAIREIAVRKSKVDIGKVFWVSHIVRQVVTVPLSIGLFLLAGWIADGIYGRPEIIPYVQLLAVWLILQGLQDVLGATLTGLKKFGVLYVVQIVTAVINVVVFGLLVWRFEVSGFFYSMLVTTTIMVFLFAAILARDLRGFLRLPSWADVKHFGGQVMRIGAYMYLARIFFVVWQRMPLLVLGGVLAVEQLGDLNVALTFGGRLTIIAMALSEVNLSWMSSMFVHERSKFNDVVTRNMQRVLVLMMSMTLVLVFFAQEILLLIDPKYVGAFKFVLILTPAFFLYSLMDIGTSSLFVSADRPRLRALVFGLMSGLTGVVMAWLLWYRPDAFLASMSVLAGAVVGYGSMLWLAKTKFKVSLVTNQLAGVLLMMSVSLGWLYQEPVLFWRTVVFVLVAIYMLYEAKKSRLLPKLTELTAKDGLKIICFAGAEYGAVAWTNRQQMMSRVSKEFPVLFIEPRVWAVRQILKYWQQPQKLVGYFVRLFWVEKTLENLWVISQWNLIPGSREVKLIAKFNHWLNRWRVLLMARILGFGDVLVVWIYDTEAVEYLSAFKTARVLYDCVDDHGVQAGVDRNPKRVEEEENELFAKSDLVTVTSKRLYKLKKDKAKNVQLVLNAGDVELFTSPTASRGAAPPLLSKERVKLVVGTVGSLDSYKLDVELLRDVIERKPEWKFIFVGKSVVDNGKSVEDELSGFSNVEFVGAVERERVPEVVRGFDVCMIPYRLSKYNAASFPLKFWEFMATGKPIVVSGLPELKEYGGLIGFAGNADEFIASVEMGLNENQEMADRRMAMAKEHGWDKRVEKVLELLKEVL